MSFRLRLTLFVVLIVVVPMVALAVLVSEIAADSAGGKADARLDTGLRTATSLYEQAEAEARRRARRIATEIAADPTAIATLEAGARPDLRPLADALATGPGVAGVRLTGADGEAVEAGDPAALASASVQLLDQTASRVGDITVSTTNAAELLEAVEETTGEEAALIGPEGVILARADLEPGDLPQSGEATDLERRGEALRAGATEPLGDEQLRIALLAPATAEGFFGSRPKVAILLLGFFCVALVAVLLLLRSLQGYVRAMLAAARRIGGGDFSESVPVSGRDEMAGLAGELNRMSARLAAQMDQLRRQRIEIESSVRRIGEAFASGLDRQALLTILVETAVGTCEADYGLVVLTGHVGAEVEVGKSSQALRSAALTAGQRALVEPGPVELEQDGAFVLAGTVGRIGADEGPIGAMIVARRDRAFSSTEGEAFLYLLTQASASIENVALHELVSRQAVTDDLTGLANKRAFRYATDKEAARAVRFGHELSLLVLDVDDFKRVNDTFGHLQGDEVLRRVAAILESVSRGIDEPARYGGEEFAVALPETGAEGALEVAERIRSAVAETTIASVDGSGEVRVTASIGVATLPGAAVGVNELIAAADIALYEAKRSGKNRVCLARANREPRSTEARTARAATAKGPASPRRT